MIKRGAARLGLAALLSTAAGCTDGTDGLGPGAAADAGAAPDAAVDAGFAPDAATDAGFAPDAAIDAGAPPDAGPDTGVDGGPIVVTYLKLPASGLQHQFGAAVAVTPDDRDLVVGAPKPLGDPVVYRFDLDDPTWSPTRAEIRAQFSRAVSGTLALAVDAAADTVWIGQADTIHLPRADQAYRGYVTSLEASGSGYAASAVDAPVPVPLSPYAWSMALNASGTRAAVSAPRHRSNRDTSEEGPGVVFVYDRGSAGWRNTFTVERPAESLDEGFGRGLAMSADGDTLAVGAPKRPQGQPRPPTDGAVYLYDLGGAAPALQATLRPDVYAFATFGAALDLSADGTTLVVGMPDESGDGIGVEGGAGTAETRRLSGAAYVYRRAGPSSWRREVYLKASNTHSEARFGAAVAVSPDGRTVAVGAPGDRAVGVGIDGDDTPGSPSGGIAAGAVFVFEQGAAGWRRAHFLKPAAPDANDRFGVAVDVGARVLAVGAPGEDSAATGADGDQTNDSLGEAGAVFVYRLP